MAKKTVKKDKIANTINPSIDVDIDNLYIDNTYIKAKIEALNKRIDNIVIAHEQCKKLKGL